MKFALKNLNKQQYSNLHLQIEQARDCLTNIQSMLNASPGDEVLRLNEAQALQDLTALCKSEESFARQKSRALWMKDGDSNSKFFHGHIKDRINSNKILSLELDNGAKIFKPLEIQSAAVSYFQKLFSDSSPSISITDEGISSYVDRSLPSGSIVDLLRLVTDDEIKLAIFKTKPDKAPGPDGYTAGFFQKMWHVVGADVCAAVKSFFESGRLLKEFNCTAITLIPKISSPTKLSDYRPISCCNTIYKCISGILAQRMKGLVPHIISSDQTAFIPRQSIADNITTNQVLNLVVQSKLIFSRPMTLLIGNSYWVLSPPWGSLVCSLIGYKNVS